MPVRRAQSNVSFALAATLLVTTPAASQECAAVSSGRVGAVGATFTAVQFGVLALRHNDWWPPPAGRFHFIWHGSASAGQDALLHASVAYQISQVAAEVWDWACVPPKLAGWLGTVMGIAAGLPKEIGDGFHIGFSGPDMVWATIGAALPGVRRQWPASRAVTYKAQYWPSAEYHNRPASGLPNLENDYAGQRYFVAINPGLAPGGSGPWPDWLGFALGHGIPHWASLPPHHVWYLTADLSFRGLPIRGSLWRKAATLLDQVHFPLPGVRVDGGGLRFGLY